MFVSTWCSWRPWFHDITLLLESLSEVTRKLRLWDKRRTYLNWQNTKTKWARGGGGDLSRAAKRRIKLKKGAHCPHSTCTFHSALCFRKLLLPGSVYFFRDTNVWRRRWSFSKAFEPVYKDIFEIFKNFWISCLLIRTLYTCWTLGVGKLSCGVIDYFTYYLAHYKILG
jgi:hypothetical protein